MFGKNLAQLRKERKLSQYDLAEKLGFSRGQVANYEQGTRQPDFDTLQKIADFFDVSIDMLLDRPTKETNRNTKDERDIAKLLKKFSDDIEHSDALAFDGEPLSEEAKESLIESMEHIYRTTQRINKKYTPKKYQDN